MKVVRLQPVPKVCMMCNTELSRRLRAFTVPLASAEKFVCKICELNISCVLRFSLLPYLNQCSI